MYFFTPNKSSIFSPQLIDATLTNNLFQVLTSTLLIGQHSFQLTTSCFSHTKPFFQFAKSIAELSIGAAKCSFRFDSELPR